MRDAQIQVLSLQLESDWSVHFEKKLEMHSRERLIAPIFRLIIYHPEKSP